MNKRPLCALWPVLLAVFAVCLTTAAWAQDTLEIPLPKGEWNKAILNGNPVYLRPGVPTAQWQEMIIQNQAPVSSLPLNPGLSKGDLVAQMVQTQMQGQYPNRIFRVLEKDNRHVIFEYRVLGSDNPLGYGFYGLNHTLIGKTHTLGIEYMTKNPGRVEDTRSEWLPILKKAKIVHNKK